MPVKHIADCRVAEQLKFFCRARYYWRLSYRNDATEDYGIVVARDSDVPHGERPGVPVSNVGGRISWYARGR